SREPPTRLLHWMMWLATSVENGGSDTSLLQFSVRSNFHAFIIYPEPRLIYLSDHTSALSHHQTQKREIATELHSRLFGAWA
ncbi:MAG: hypothetical protein ACK56F_15455, partial [bacterium]